jgi:hypothetical protein
MRENRTYGSEEGEVRAFPILPKGVVSKIPSSPPWSAFILLLK